MSEINFENEPITELEPDEPPKSGTWVDTCDVLTNPTEEELEEGERLGNELPEDDDGKEFE